MNNPKQIFNTYDWLSVFCALSLDAMRYFLEDVDYPLAHTTFPNVQRACRTWVRGTRHRFEPHVVMFDGPDDEIALSQQVQESLLSTIGKVQANVFWAWAEEMCLQTPLSAALEHFFDQWGGVNAPPPPVPELLRPWTVIIKAVGQIYTHQAVGVSYGAEMAGRNLHQDGLEDVQAVYGLTFIDPPGEHVMRTDAHHYIGDMALYWQAHHFVARLRRILPSEVHDALYTWIAASGPDDTLEMSVVRVALERVQPSHLPPPLTQGE